MENVDGDCGGDADDKWQMVGLGGPHRDGHSSDGVSEKRKILMVTCFTVKWVVVLAVVTASLLVLPPILPPLPPPPMSLMLFPVGIMAFLTFLAFSPADRTANAVVFTV
ncbi:unnamed protein product [Ilex paraguariensis]|uniref:Uncharacterized protein n=1 Tax=Ilex paraguariensis TaxID=185542 RepID=A0ABC8T8X0_9AQUA